VDVACFMVAPNWIKEISTNITPDLIFRFATSFHYYYYKYEGLQICGKITKNNYEELQRTMNLTKIYEELLRTMKNYEFNKNLWRTMKNYEELRI